MKKKLSILLAICLVAAVAISCGKNEPEAEPEITPPATAEATEEVTEANLNPDLKASLDDFEALADRYVEACENYFSAVESGKKASKLEKEYKSIKEEFNTSNKDIDGLESGLEAVDLEYYKEVTIRVTEKVAAVLEKHADAVQMLLEQNAN